MAVGEYNYHTNAELLSVNDNTWAVIDSYPFVMGIDIFHFFIFLKWFSLFIPDKASSLSYAPIIYLSDAFYVIGGWSGRKESTIGRFDLTTRQWTKSGDLVSGRRGHNVIYDGNYLLVIGGDGNLMSRKCSIENGQVACISQTPELNKYSGYPLNCVPDGNWKEMPWFCALLSKISFKV